MQRSACTWGIAPRAPPRPPRLPLAPLPARADWPAPSMLLLGPAPFLDRAIRGLVRLAPRDRRLYVVCAVELSRQILDQVVRLGVRQLALLAQLRLHLRVLR